MRRAYVVIVAATAAVLLWAVAASAAPPTPYTAGKAVKLNVLGEWAHPDDDTSIIGPCGVWHDRYGIRCGIIMVTRGEGGGNAVGSEIGPDLGLRRENEDRVAHYRSGTVDIFNLDRIDFFYNTSAPLTQAFWDREGSTLERVTRIIRMTQPDVYIGFNPSLVVGHGNHQQAGRYIWEGVKAAADPTMFPEQLTGPNALSTWQVKKVFSGGFTGGPTQGTGGNTSDPHCTTGFVPAATNTSTVAGVWTGYDSPYKWPAGNLQGIRAGQPKSWAQVAAEGSRAYPTQSRVMYQDTALPGCSRFGMTDSYVPFQPNVGADGTTPNPAAGKDDAIFDGATDPDPGGLPLGTLEYLELSDFFNAPGAPFDVTVHLRSGKGTLAAGKVDLRVPAGWGVDAASKDVGAVTTAGETEVTFTVTPAAGATVNSDYRISALYTTGALTGYTEDVVRVVAPVEGRFQRWGKWAEYDTWLTATAPAALRVGRSGAVQPLPMGGTVTVPVVVHNWSDATQDGDVSLTLPANVTADATSKPYGPLAPGADETVEFELTSAHPTLPTPQTADVGITTSFGAEAGATETLQLSILPTTAIPAGAAPTVDGTQGAGEYTGPALDVGRRWEGTNCDPVGTDCGTTGSVGDPATSTFAKVQRSGDDLYFFVHVRDDFQSYAVTPSECVAHWLADSVEFLIDPRGNSSERNTDTASTFKLGVFPFTNDPSNSNGNGVNGPCWSRDADNHQGYATGPLQSKVADAPNAPGVQVASSATWVGSNAVSTPHAYAGGGYDLEVKIPMAILPAAVDPARMGLNITPYDNDDNSANGVLRHIDLNQTRVAWSAFGSVQSDPYRWGVATLPGYTPPAGRPTVAPDANVSNPNLNGVLSPQTIAQSAHDGVPIAGRVPAPAGDRITSLAATLAAGSAELDITASGPGTAWVYLWSGVEGQIPVWATSCSPADDPPPDYGMTACAATDGGVPPWGTDMSGRVVARKLAIPIATGAQHVSIPLDAAARARLAADGSALVSFETAAGEVQAFDAPLAQPSLFVRAERGGGPGGPALRLAADVGGTAGFPGTPTGTVQFKLDGANVGAPVPLDGAGRAHLDLLGVDLAKGHTVTADYSGDGDYVARSASASVAGTPGPPSPPGKPAVLTVQCRLTAPKRVRCTIRQAGTPKTRITVRARLAGRRKAVTRSGRGKVSVTVRSRKRIKRGQKVRLRITAAGRTTRLSVKPARGGR